MRIAVTGAQGYLGSQICQRLRADGHEVFELVRRPSGSPQQILFVLGTPMDPGIFRSNGIESLVHVAYDFHLTGWDSIRRTNCDGSIALFKSFKEEGGRHGIYVSTIAAWDGCRSLYGRAKLKTEEAAGAHGFWILRPGLIRGGAPGGIVGTMIRFLRWLPAVPVIGYGLKCLHGIGVGRLCEVVSRIAVRSPTDREDALVIAAEEMPMSLDEVLRETLVEQRLGPRILIPCPWQPVWAVIRFFEVMGISIGLRSDSVISLMNQDPKPRLRNLDAL